MSYLERPGCTCRAAGDPAAYMHDEGCPARGRGVSFAVRPACLGASLVDEGRSERNALRAGRVRTELARIHADIAVGSGPRGVILASAAGEHRLVDGLAALGLLIELPDGAGTQAAWSALLALPEIT